MTVAELHLPGASVGEAPVDDELVSLIERLHALDLASIEGLLEERRIDSASREPRYLLVAGNGARLQLSRSAHGLLKLLSSSRDAPDLARRLKQRAQGPFEQTLSACSLLVERMEGIVRGPGNALPASYWLKIRLIPHRWVARVSERLTFLFRPPSVAVLLTTVALGFWLAFRDGLSVAFEPGTLPAGYLLFFLSLVIHELGHSSACARYGAKPSDIGFTMYLIYPALYSDVSDAWRLSRWQRVVVDAGGGYLQLAVGAVFVFAHQITGQGAFWTAFLLVLYCNLFSLNPIFRFDGYWLLADALGVTNLSRQPKRIVGWLLARLRDTAAPAPPWPWPVLAFLVVYSAITLGLWSLFIVVLVPMVWRRLESFVPDLQTAFLDLSRPPHVPTLEHLKALGVSSMLLAFTLWIAWRATAPLRRVASRWLWRNRCEEPVDGKRAA